MSDKIHYIFRKSQDIEGKANQELISLLGHNYVRGLLADFKDYAKEIDTSPLTGTFS
ncbi:hypothetical protein MJH12_04210 [bacterium]|nr:hypothetical protein [bacterium]